MFTITYRTDLKSHFKASRQIYYKTPAAKIFYSIFIGLPIIVLIFSFSREGGPFALAFGTIPIWALVALMLSYPLVLIPWMQYANVKRTYLASPVAKKDQNFEISESGIRNFGEGFDAMIEWGQIVRIEKSKDFLLLFISKTQAYYLPKEKVSADALEKIESWWEGRQGEVDTGE